MQPVFAKLQTLEIMPEPAMENRPESIARSQATEATDTTGESMPLLAMNSENSEAERITPEDLVARVIRRAGELRQEWAAA